MSTRAPSATDWVKTLPRGGRVDWNELEAHVLREHREVLRLLGPAAGEVRTSSRAFTVGALILLIPLSIIALGIVFAPIWGLATLAGDPFGIRDVDGQVAIPVAGASLIVAVIVQVVLLVRSVRGAADVSGIGGGTAVVAVVIAIGIWIVGARQSVDGWQWWFALAIVTVVLGLGNEVRARRRAATEERTASAPDTAPTPAPEPASASAPSAPLAPEARGLPTSADSRERDRRIDAAIAAIPADVRAQLLDDRRRALEWLRMQGSITPEQAARGIGAPLGRLGDAG